MLQGKLGRDTGPYFEGWYLKHQNSNQTVALIPGVSRRETGEEMAFLQIITSEGAWQVDYPITAFRASRKKFWVQVGENYFTSRGAWIKVEQPGLKIQGKIGYGPFTSLHYDIMGPFGLLPGLECRHGVLSMDHWLEGSLQINGTWYDFSRGRGYLEKDWGSSFPQKYLWSQSNDLPGGNCVMLAVAQVPLGPLAITGCIGVVIYRGRQYRLGTYLGGRAESWNSWGGVVTQGKLRLEAQLLGGEFYPLRAPISGSMEREIRESPACQVAYRFWHGDKLLFSSVSHQAGFEYSELGENHSG